jgi:hypothetical protein
MHKSIRLHDLGRLSEPEKTKALRELALSAQARPMTLIEARVRRFEARYELSSAEMQKKVSSGSLTETAAIASWLIALDVIQRLRGDAAQR